MREVEDGVFKVIVELSDIEMQRDRWLSGNQKNGYISSYVELMCSLFDDFNFDVFIKKTAYECGLSESTIIELNKLRDLLDNYNEKNSDEEILNDPEWNKIVNHAKKVVLMWDKD